jgi:excisionase family DNA binding protein
MDLGKEFFTIEQLSEYLNLKRSTLYLQVETGQIPHYRIGRLLRFKKAEIDEWLASHRIAPKTHRSPKMGDFAKDPPVAVVNNMVEEAIEDITGKRYTLRTGKPERFKGLRKEVEHVTQ